MQRVALADRHHVRTDKGATAGDEFAIDAPTQDCARLRLVSCAIGNDSYILYIKMTFKQSMGLQFTIYFIPLERLRKLVADKLVADSRATDQERRQ